MAASNTLQSRTITRKDTTSRGKGTARGSKKEFLQFLHIVYPVKYAVRWLFHGAGDLCPKLRHNLPLLAP